MDGWTLYLDGEPPFEVNPRDHNESARAALDASVALVALSLSCPLGVEYLPIDEAVPLLDAWHTGVAAFGTPFVGWASVSHVEPDLVGLRGLLAADFVGAQVSATELADPHALERLAPVLEVAQSAGRAVLVHPGPVAPRASAWSGEPGWWPAVVDYAAQMQAAWWTWSLVGRSLLPTVRICFAAGAGLAPLHHERFTARGGGPLVVDRDAFVDTSSYARTGLRGLISVLGDDVVVMGSDRPYAPPTDPDLGPEATEAIRVTNPARLLGR
jgi:hypothetical protein